MPGSPPPQPSGQNAGGPNPPTIWRARKQIYTQPSNAQPLFQTVPPVIVPFDVGVTLALLLGGSAYSTAHRQLGPLFQRPSLTVARAEETYPFHDGRAVFTPPPHLAPVPTWPLAVIVQAEPPRPPEGSALYTGPHEFAPLPQLVPPVLVSAEPPTDLLIGLSGSVTATGPHQLAPKPTWPSAVYARAEEPQSAAGAVYASHGGIAAVGPIVTPAVVVIAQAEPPRPAEGYAWATGPHQFAPLPRIQPVVIAQAEPPRPGEGYSFATGPHQLGPLPSWPLAVIAQAEPPRPGEGYAFATGPHLLAPPATWLPPVTVPAEPPRPGEGWVYSTGVHQFAAIFQQTQPVTVPAEPPRPESGAVYLAHGGPAAIAPTVKTASAVIVQAEPPQPERGYGLSSGPQHLKPQPGQAAPHWGRGQDLDYYVDQLGGGSAWASEPIYAAPQTAGYNIYSNAGAGPINYGSPVAVVYGLTWTSTALAYPDTWRFGVRAFNANGIEENLDASVTIILDASGIDITNRPKPPVALRALARAGGTVRVEWGYNTINPSPVPTGFHVYLGTGGTPNYGTVAATVSFQSAIAGSFVTDIPGLINGTAYTFGVRAYNATAEEPNTSTVTCTADSAGPAAVTSLAATAIV